MMIKLALLGYLELAENFACRKTPKRRTNPEEEYNIKKTQ